MKKRLLFLLFLFVVHPYILSAQTVNWAKASTGVYGWGSKVIPLADSGVVMYGVYGGNGTLGDMILEKSGTSPFLSKFNAKGKGLWYKVLKGLDQASAISADQSGNIYLAGKLEHPISTFMGYAVPAETDINSIYLFKLDSVGTCTWLKKIGSLSKGNTVASLSIDKSGDILITGAGSVGSSIDTFGLTPMQMYVARFNAAGTLKWLQQSKGPGRSFATAIDTDDTGNAYITGSIRNENHWTTNQTVSFGDYSIKADTANTFVVKYSLDGQCQWALSAGGRTSWLNDHGLGIVADGSGNTYVVGNAQGNTSFGDKKLQAFNSSFSSYIAKFNTNGYCEWVIGGLSSQSQNISGSIALYKNNIFVGGTFSGSISFNGNVTKAQTEGKNMYIANFNTDGTFNWLTLINDGLETSYGRAVNDIAINNNGQIYVTGKGERQPIFISQYHQNANSVTGKIFADINNNGVFDEGDEPKSQVVVTASPGGNSGISDKDGNYKLYLPNGEFVVNIPALPKYYESVITSDTITFASSASIAISRDFILKKQPEVVDARVTLTSSSEMRPGFESVLTVNLKNLGTVTEKGVLKLKLDAKFEYISSVPEATMINGELVWNYEALGIEKESYFNVKVKLPVTTTLGIELLSLAKVSPQGQDVDTLNNTSTLKAVVVGSYDPNDKAVSYATYTPGQVKKRDWIEYLIRFQNKGTAKAIFVSVKDTLSDLLDVSSFEMLGSSHQYSIQLTDQGALEWYFAAIDLPAEMHNEPGSHGFIRFRIKPKTTVVLNDKIANTAFIYFDYNPAVVTNTVVTTIGKHSQAISLPPVADVLVGSPALTLTATADSKLPVVYELISGPATLAGNTVTIAAAGKITIRATQSGNTDYAPAEMKEISFCSLPQKPFIAVLEDVSGATLSSSSTQGNQWYKDNVAIEGATTATCKINGAGVYAVKVTINDCSNISEPTLIASTDNLKEQGLQIYPNPVVDKVKVQYHGTMKNGKVEIYNMLGEKLFEKPMEQEAGSWSTDIDLGSLASHIYILRIQGAGKAVSQVIHKQ